jgi:cell wall-associated NlpC family hydrolase
MKEIDVRDLMGIKYTDCGKNREEGFDCWYLAVEVLRRAGIEVPSFRYESSAENDTLFGTARDTGRFVRVENFTKYCIIVIQVHGKPSHCGVYLGGGRMIHTTRRQGVCIEPVQRWSNRIVGCYEVKNTHL